MEGRSGTVPRRGGFRGSHVFVEEQREGTYGKKIPVVCLLICAFSDPEGPGSGLSLGVAVSRQMDTPGPALKERSVSWTSKSAKTQAQQDVFSTDAGVQAADLGGACVSVMAGTLPTLLRALLFVSQRCEGGHCFLIVNRAARMLHITS